MSIAHPNRISKKSKTRSHKAYWCEKCDAQLVHKNETCPHCGFNESKFKNSRSLKPQDVYIEDE